MYDKCNQTKDEKKLFSVEHFVSNIFFHVYKHNAQFKKHFVIFKRRLPISFWKIISTFLKKSYFYR